MNLNYREKPAAIQYYVRRGLFFRKIHLPVQYQKSHCHQFYQHRIRQWKNRWKPKRGSVNLQHYLRGTALSPEQPAATKLRPITGNELDPFHKLYSLFVKMKPQVCDLSLPLSTYSPNRQPSL